MDPNATYEMLCEGLTTGNIRQSCDAANALKGWFGKGGFLPDKMRAKLSPAAMANVMLHTSWVLEMVEQTTTEDEDGEDD